MAVETEALPESIGKYRIRQHVGEGGMGTVYHAHDPVLRRDVALKVIRKRNRWKQRAAQRFTREAQSLARINNPHVVQIYDFSAEGDLPYLVMELVNGKSLKQLLQREGRYDFRKLFDCAWQLLSGLNVAHRAGLIHRDIKPGNVLLSADGTYKLVDFGLAREEDNDGTITGDAIVGTCRYLSPEVARGCEATPGSDLYSLGVTLYEMATGGTPYTDDNTLALLNRIAHQPVPPLNERRPNTPPSIVKWFDRLLALSPEDRFQTALEARSALDDIADDMVGEHRPTTAKTKGPSSHDETVTTATGTRVVETIRPAGTLPVPAITDKKPEVEQPKVRFILKMIMSVWLVSSAATILGGYLISQHSMRVQLESWREELRSLAAGAALLVDGDAHAKLTEPDHMDTPEFKKIYRDLRRFQATSNRIKFIYSMQRDPKTGVVSFVVDAAPELDENGNGKIDDNEVTAKIGDVYEEAAELPALLAGFDRAAADEDVSSDQWGVFLSGYAPIRDSSGKSVGIIGLDVTSSHIDTIKSQFYLRSSLMLIATLIAFLAAGCLLIMRLNRPMQDLFMVLRQVAGGDLNAKATVRGNDEFRQFAVVINHMISGLKERDRIRNAFDRYITREVNERLPGSARHVEGQRSIYLYCDLGSIAEDPQALESLLRDLLDIIFHNGAVAERVVGEGILAAFANEGDDDKAVAANAIRTALQLQGAVEAKGNSELRLGIGIVSRDENLAGDDSASLMDEAMNLGRANRDLGTDILTCEATFAEVRQLFIADRLRGVILQPDDAPRSYIAIKAAVAG